MCRPLYLLLALSGLATSLLSRDACLYVATQSKSGNSIHVYSLNEQTGALTARSRVEGVKNCWFIDFSPDGRRLYASTDSSSIAAFSVSSVDGSLAALEKDEDTGGSNPIHLAVSPNGKILVSGQYMSGDAAVFGILPDGSLSDRLQAIAFSGSSVHARQDASHPHAVVFSPDGNYVFITDLGTDRIEAFAVDYSLAEPLVHRPDLAVSVMAGSGPRHFEFNPAGTYAYLVEELSGTLSVYSYSKGTLEFVERADAFSGPGPGRSGADIEITKDGRFLYYSNRADDNTIAIFSIHQSTGEVSLIGHQPSGGNFPNSITLDRSDRFLIVGNRKSGNVVVFARNRESGLLSTTGKGVRLNAISSLAIGVL